MIVTTTSTSAPIRRRSARLVLPILCGLLLAIAGPLSADDNASPPASQPATHPSTAPIDPALLKRLREIDARAAKITELTADFEQWQHTALLRKPLISTGHILIKGAAMRWDTQHPEPSSMYIDEHEAKLYYPKQAMLEVYTLDQQLGQLAASPLPRLDVLLHYFDMAEVPAADLGNPADKTSGLPADTRQRVSAGELLPLRLTPNSDALKQHVAEVRVLLDVQRGYILWTDMTDVDGDHRVIAFTHIKTNLTDHLNLPGVELSVPHGTTISHPLDAAQSQ